ncbi:MAG: high-affinity nickel-transport family protein [Candidatus Acidiferrales bacterium]|jgi:ABC-type nickel/cobalt efflux system permease component RcnA
MSAAWGRVRGLAKYLGAQQSSAGKMITLLSIIALGFFLGMRHATDPDHVIAVTTIVSRQRSIRHAALIGILWGLGHTITIFLVGSAIILFGVVIPPKLGLTMELSVGLMLILLGVLNLAGFTRWITETFTPQSPDAPGHPHLHSHAHTHQQGDFVHAHPHHHEPEKHGHAEDATPVGWMDRIFGQLGLYQAVRPLAVGLVHGLAGSAAVALLVLTTIRDPRWAIAYLLVFGVGTIAGMMLITAAIALPFKYSQSRFARLNRGLAVASGIISIAFGIFIVYQMGYVNGIFTSHPHWTPE